MAYYTDNNGVVSYIKDEVEINDNFDEVPEPPEDSTLKGGNTLYRWDSDNDKFVEEITPPPPNTAFEEIQQKFVDWEGSLDAGLDRLDSILDSYPTADRALNNGNYEIVKNRINKAESDGKITSSEAQDIIDILDGK